MRKVAFALCVLLQGCMVGPNYRSPEPCLPDTWVSDPQCQEEGEPLTAWWQAFNDPQLNHIIALAATYNYDIQIAYANILQACALRKMTASSLYPQVNLDMNVTRTYFSKNGPVFSIGAGTASPSTGLPFQLQVPQIQNIYTALFDVSWQIDLFGKIRRSVEVANAQIGVAVEERNGVLLSVIAETAQTYLDLRGAQKMGQLIEENLTLVEKKWAITKQQLEKGLIEEITFASVDAELEELRALLPPVVSQIYRDIYTLSLLTGSLPEALMEELLPIAPLPFPALELACGPRSDLLRRRPDVRQAERNLAAATANVGVAVASFFPSFTFLGGVGLQSLNIRQLFQAKSVTWSTGGASSLPIFQGGYLVGNLRLSEAEAAQAASSYAQTVLRALEEAESALITYEQNLQSVASYEKRVEDLSKIDTITAAQFTGGLVDAIQAIEAERRRNTAEQELLISETNTLLDLVTLYKALGGGWECWTK